MRTEDGGNVTSLSPHPLVLSTYGDRMAAIKETWRGVEPEKRAAASRRRWRALKPWLFLFPLLFFNVVVILGPSLGTIYFAFTDWSGIGAAKWTGLANFQRMLNDKVFWRAFTNNLVWTAIFLTVPIAMGLMGAALMAPIPILIR